MSSLEAIRKKLSANGGWKELSKVVLRVIRDQPNDALRVFETLVQQAEAQAGGPLEGKAKDAAVTALTKSLNLLRPPAPAKPAEGEPEPEPEEAPAEMPYIPNLLNNGNVLSAAGINLGAGEMYNVSLSIYDFAIEQAKKGNNFKSIRFFGKILGTRRDYYVIECGKDEWAEPAEGEAKLAEPMGTGTNQYQYWVTNEAGSGADWSALPPVTPQQLAVAKRVRKFFSGDLGAAVPGYPYFPWKEAGYLRCQIAQITSDTIISPAGVWKFVDDAEEPKPIELNEEFKGVSASDILTPSRWTTHRAYIMPELGRCVPPEPENEEEEKKANPVSLLTPCDQDPRTKGNLRVSLCSPFGIRPESDPNAVVCAYNLAWSGAACVYQGQNIVNVYVGYGFKRTSERYMEPEPPVPAQEFALSAEQEDPIKKEEPAKEEGAAEEKKDE